MDAHTMQPFNKPSIILQFYLYNPRFYDIHIYLVFEKERSNTSATFVISKIDPQWLVIRKGTIAVNDFSLLLEQPLANCLPVLDSTRKDLSSVSYIRLFRFHGRAQEEKKRRSCCVIRGRSRSPGVSGTLLWHWSVLLPRYVRPTSRILRRYL